jgi:hypothetical protein
MGGNYGLDEERLSTCQMYQALKKITFLYYLGPKVSQEGAQSEANRKAWGLSLETIGGGFPELEPGQEVTKGAVGTH